MTLTALLRLALRRLWRQARAGEYRLLIAALLLAAASTTGVERLAARAGAVLDRQAGELVAADLALRSTEAIPTARLEAAAGGGLTTARTAQFRSMLAVGERFVLSDLKAAEAAWPLRGALDLRRGASPEAVARGEGERVTRAAAPGELWLEPALGQRLGVGEGDAVQVGKLKLPVAGWIVSEPDRGSDFLGLAPRALMAWADLEASGLIAPGSRVQYRLLVAGPQPAVEAWAAVMRPALTPHERFIDVQAEQGNVRETVERARRFLALASLTVVIVSGVAVALAGQRLARRERTHVALMRAWGADGRTTLSLIGLETLCLGLFTAVPGVLAGVLAEALVAGLALPAVFAGVSVPATTGCGRGLAVAALTLLLFAGPTLWQLARVPPIEVLRSGRSGGSVPRHLVPAALLLAVVLLPWDADTRALSGWVLLGLAGLVLVQAVAGLAFVQLAGRLRIATGGPWRQGLASLARRRGEAVLQLVAVSMGLTLLLVLTLVQRELIASWGQRLAEGTPNHFLINILPEEAEAVQERIAAAGVASPALYPMIRGRLTAIDGEPVDPATLPDGRARQLAEREFNLSIARRPQQDNRIVAGRFWGSEAAEPGQFSAERGIADLLGFGLGSELTFSVAGQLVTARVSSLREVQWDSFNVNFFVVAPPGLLEGLPQTFVTSFHLPPAARAGFASALVQAHPSVSIIDVEAQLAALQGFVDRAAQGLSGVFLLSLAASALVLLGALAGSQDARRREAAVMLALGASRARLRASLAAEFAVLGLSAGLVASLAAAAIGVTLGREVFQLDYSPGLLLFVAGPLAGLIGVVTVGLAGTADVMRTPPARVLAAEGG
jgi:putative ABC transport system permease protein